MVTPALVDDTEMPNAPPSRSVSLFGATGSIGSSAVDLLRRYPAIFSVDAVTAGSDAAALARIAIELDANLAVVADGNALPELREALSGTGIETAGGPGSLVEAAQRKADIVIAAIVGAAGLEPTLAAIEAGSDIALANKECLVCAGDLFMNAAAQAGVRLLPVDSEHNAIFQALGSGGTADVDRIVLTASGGPFRGWTREKLETATPDQAAAHPNWSMGKKISVDSSTLLNKGLELIEAHHLFGLEGRRIEVLVHPQSIVHGLVMYRDGSVIAQMSVTDMRVPLAHCLWWPTRRSAPAKRLDLAAIGSLDFEEPDPDRFPALPLARRALDTGGWATNMLNAANEVAVDAFLNHAIGYLDIVRVSQEVLDRGAALGLPESPETVGQALEIDSEGRQLARECLSRLAGRREITETN